jgi:hypothetical protein
VFQEHFSLRFAYVRDSLAWQVNIQQQLLLVVSQNSAKSSDDHAYKRRMRPSAATV